MDKIINGQYNGQWTKLNINGQQTKIKVKGKFN